MKTAATALLFAILALLFIYSSIDPSQNRQQTPQSQTSLLLHESRLQAPRLDVLVDGTEVELQQMLGQVVYVNFWAYWCPPCIEELPLLNTISQSALTSGAFSSLIINLDTDEQNIVKAQKFLQEAAPELSFVRLSTHSQAKDNYLVNSLPLHILIDKKGRVALRYTGTLVDKGDLFIKLVRQLQGED